MTVRRTHTYTQQLGRLMPRGAADDFVLAPPAVASQVACWWASDLAMFNGDPVSAWTDRVGGFTVSQTLTGRPTYLASVSTIKRPAVDFDGSNDVMAYTAADAVSTATTGCIITVLQSDTMAAAMAPWASADEATAVRHFNSQIEAADRMLMQQRNNDTADLVIGTTTTLVVDTPYALEWSSSGTAYELRVNNVVQAESVTSGTDSGDWFGDTANRDNFAIGAMKRSTTVTFYDGKIALVLVADAPLSTDDRVLLYRWIADYYGIV